MSNQSQKITPKNLHYNTTLPPFLARLRGETTTTASGGPDPILAGRRRAAKPRSASEEAEDVPLVVDERGNVVDSSFSSSFVVDKDGGVTSTSASSASKSRDGNLNGTGDGDGGREDEKETTAAGEMEKSRSSGGGMVDVGGGGGNSKKRKVGRVVGAENEGKEEDGSGGATKEKQEIPTTKAKGAKKTKKIKLSFGDDEG